MSLQNNHIVFNFLSLQPVFKVVHVKTILSNRIALFLIFQLCKFGSKTQLYYKQIAMQGEITRYYREQHLKYIFNLHESKNLYSKSKFLTEHLKVNGAYWTLTTLSMLNYQLPKQKQEEIVDWLKKCKNKDGGYGGNVGHDSHIQSTHYALLIFILFDRLNQVNTEQIIDYVSKLQQPDGSFFGDKWGEVDARFSYLGVACLKILNALHTINLEKAADYVLSCRNFDGSFGGIPDSQSHSAYVFCCVGTLKITGYLESFDHELLAKWLCQRQTSKGGFNGRPQKLPDVCYSWWIYSTFCMMGKQDWVDQGAFQAYILSCQDIEDGGIGQRPCNIVDIFHLFYGTAALSLLNAQKHNLQPIDPTYIIPKKLVSKIAHLAQ